ncbi:MAG: helix-turn-helix domain-containing protein [Haloarculaceae archaeon]
MPQAELSITVPEGVWIGDVTRAHPEARVRVLAALTDEASGVGLAEVDAPDVSSVVAAVDDQEDVTALEVLRQDEETALIQFETTTPLLLLPMQESGVPLEFPFTLRAGEATWDVTAPHDRLSALGDQLRSFGIQFTVERVREPVEPEQLLTDRQLTLVENAVERGYYDTPRTCTLTDLATDLGLAKSTCSEVLHRAEGKIVKQFLGAEV